MAISSYPLGLGALDASTLPPSGPAGGDLTGTYPNPTVAHLEDNGFTINNSSDATKQMQFNLSGSTASTILTLASAQTASRTLTIPVLAGPDTIPTLATAQTFTAVQTISANVAGGVGTGSLVVGSGGAYITGNVYSGGGFIGSGNSFSCTYAPAAAQTIAFSAAGTATITGGVTDGYTSSLGLAPTYSAATALTVTRHNYINLVQPVLSGVGPAAVTDAAVFRFNANIGTHLALAADGSVACVFTSTSGPTGAATSIQGWMKINVNGTLRYIPMW